MARIWDPFLTDRDRVALAREPDDRVGFGSRPALLLVDLYRGAFGDEPLPLEEAVKLWPSACGLVAWESLPRIQHLLEASRGAGLPVVHVTGLGDSGMKGWSEAIHPGGGRRGAGRLSGTDRYARRYEIVSELAPIPGEVVLRKAAPSAFWGTPLVGYLLSRGVDTLIVAGEATSGCVRATVVDAASNRFHVTVAEDCVFDRHEATHAINLFDMHQKYADVMPLAEVRAWIEGHTARGSAAEQRG